MGGKWKEVVRLRFKGERFRDHAFDLSALGELSQFQKMIAETAKALWRDANPNSERLPRHFEQRTRLCLRKIEGGSATAPLEVFIENPDEPELWEKVPEELNQAITLAHEVFKAVERDVKLPDHFPKHLVSEYVNWGQSLSEDDVIEIKPPNKEPAIVSSRNRDRLSAFAETPYVDLVDTSGKVLEADVRQHRFQLWPDEKRPVGVIFNEEQEEIVTTALKDHKSVRLHVTGRGEYSPEGLLQKITDVQSLEIVKPGASKYDKDAPSIEEVLQSIADEVPKEEWDKLPPDLTDDLDHYLYGTPKQ